MGSAAEGQDSRAPACQDSIQWKLAPYIKKVNYLHDLDPVTLGSIWDSPYLPILWIWLRLRVIKTVKTVIFAKIVKKRKWPLWPWLWPCDLEVNIEGWSCPYLPMTKIWARLKVIKAVKSHFPSLTLDVNYLTLRAKIWNSASCNFCVWSLGAYLCNFSTLLSKL